jgi:hypothetical protein
VGYDDQRQNTQPGSVQQGRNSERCLASRDTGATIRVNDDAQNPVDPMQPAEHSHPRAPVAVLLQILRLERLDGKLDVVLTIRQQAH